MGGVGKRVSDKVVQKIIDEFKECAIECAKYAVGLDYELCAQSCIWSLSYELSEKYNIPKATVRKILMQYNEP
jgi:hypothetical protein